MFIPLAYQIWKTINTISSQVDLAKECVCSKYRVEPENNVNDIFDWLSIVRNVTPSVQSVSYNLHAPIWMALRKRGVTF